MSFFKKAQTNLARVKQVAMAKMGQAEATVDAAFNQEEARFKEQYKKMRKLSNYIQNYQTAIKDLHVAQHGMAQMLLDQYEPHHRMFQVATQLNERTSQDLEQLRQRMDQYVAENFHQPLSQYLAQYKQLEDRIAERNKRLVDMDRYRLEVKQLTERAGPPDPQRLQMASQKAEAKTYEYNALNDELMKDIPKLLDDRSTYFDSLFANLVDAQLQYLRDAANVLGSLEGGLSGVNRTDFQKHQQVITDDIHSNAGRKSEGAPPAGFSGAPPQQQQQAPPGQMTQQQMMQQQQQMQQQQMQQQQMQQQQMRQQQQMQQQQMMQQQQQAQAAPAPYGGAPPAAAGAARAQALYPFQGQDATELSFQFNDVITVIRQGGEWWEGELNGQRGLFPSNYVKLL